MGSKLSYTALIILRLFEGLGGGVTFPAMNVLITAWAPDSERSMIASLIYGGKLKQFKFLAIHKVYYIDLLTMCVFLSFYFLGTAIGTVISLVTSGLIADNPKLGWEGVFYIHGGLCLIWCILWTIFVCDCPEKHHFISAEELEYIQNDQCSKHRTNVITVLWDPYVKNIHYFNWNQLNHLNHKLCIFHIQGEKTQQKSSLAWNCKLYPILGITHSACFEQLRLVHVTCGASNVPNWWTWVWNKRGRFDYEIKLFQPKKILSTSLEYTKIHFYSFLF